MAMGRRSWIIAALAVLVLAGISVLLIGRQDAGPPVSPVTDQEPPPPLAHTFEWRDGAVRSVDIPMRVQIDSLGVTLPLYAVADMRSDPGEDKVAFLQRVRRDLARYSDRQTHEACAEICSDGKTYSVRITTTASVVYCLVAPICMDGQASIGEAIHSHCPYRRGLRATLADEIISGGSLGRGEPFGRCDTEHFSRTDFAARKPSWLAGRRALYRHDGPGKVTRIERD